MIGREFSHYKIVRKLGEGGMGEVYLAEDTDLERKVALKFLAAPIAHDADALERFKREAKAAAALSHPHIIAIHEVGVCDDQPYIAMSYVEGTSLSQMIREGQLPIGRAVDIACQICDGLVEAHRSGIVHRDIKPDNIHVDRDGRVRILDFGLAMRPALPKITQEQTTLGTMGYMSPEQAMGKQVDHRSDLFSLGTVLYEMLAGRAPFDGPHPAAVLYAIVNQAPPPIRQFNAAVGDPIVSVLDQALEKEPARRYPSAGEMLAALRRAGGPAAQLERVRRKSRRTLTVGAVALLGGLLLANVIDHFMSRERVVSQSLAVLPLTNLSGDAEQDFFVDGMTDALITRLAQIRALKVISRTSAMRYRDSDKSLQEIAEELNVAVIVEGAVLRSGDQVRVTAQLIDAASDNHLWAQTYSEVDVSDVISLQSKVASEIAQEVSVRVTPDERARLDSGGSAHPDAYDAYLQGRFYFNRRTSQDMARAIDYFTQAIAFDSAFAPAFAGIADCYTARAMWNWDSSHNTFPRARYACERALRIDPDLAEAHASLAMVQLFYDWDWTAAEASFRRAIDLNPNYATAYHWYGLALMSLGRYPDAIRRMQEACELDPFAPIMLVALSQAYDMNGQYERALESVDRAFELFPEFGYAWLAKSWIAYHQGRFQEAVDCSRTAMSLHIDRAEVILVAALAGLGDRDGAKRALDDALSHEGLAYHVRAALYAYHGDLDRAFEMAELAIGNREWFVVAFGSRWLEPLHDDPRFRDLMRGRLAIKGV
jgi:serine/threonine-protein kinase